MSLPLTAGTWTLDKAHSTVGFGVRHLGISTLSGLFTEADASLDVGEDLASSSLSASIEMSSIDTSNVDRDGHLKGTDIFDVDSKPKLTFASTGIEAAGEGYKVAGDLSLGDKTTPVTLDVTFFGTETFPFDGSTHAGFQATGVVDKTALGIDFNVPLTSGGFMLSDNIDISLNVQLIGPAA